MVLLLVGLGVGFGGGYFFKNYQISKQRSGFMMGANGGANGAQRFTGTRTGGQNGVGMMNRGGVNGSILSMDDKSITVKLVDGSSKIILFSTSTTYSNTVTSSKNDLKTGVEVAIFGTTNSDGSITATSVQLNPAFGKTAPSPVPAK